MEKQQQTPERSWQETITLALENNDADLFRETAEEIHPADIAAILTELETPRLWEILSWLPITKQAEIFDYFSGDLQAALAVTMKRRKLAELFYHMSSDDRADLFNRLSEEQQQTLLPALAQAERNDIRLLSGFQEGTAGAIMTSDYASLPLGINAGEAINRLRQEAPDKETIYDAYVLDSSRKIQGVISLRDLILADPREKIENIMITEVISIETDAPQLEATKKIALYDLIALPVVNEEECLVGIITYDDAMDVVEAETTEDFHKSATVGTILGSVGDASIGLLYKKRVPWLVLLVFGNLFSAAGLSFFEDVIAAKVALVFFLPILIGSAGNAGSQSATLMIRALATGDVEQKDWFRMIGKELLVASALGLTMMLAISCISVLRSGIEIAIVVALTMFLVVLVGGLIGVSMPFILSKCKLDPATASTPLITAIADATGVIIYFYLASIILF